MKKRTVFGLWAVLFLTVPDFSFAEDITAYYKVGGEFKLRPTFDGTISDISWKFKGDLIAEWVKGIVTLDYYGKFKNRTTLDTTSGLLVMKDLKADDAGTYTVEINNMVHPQRFIGKAIKVVPAAELWAQPLSCNSEIKSCSLVCGNGKEDISEAEPITYEWKEDSGHWQSKGKTIPISKTDSASIKTYSCKMKNPVSEEESKPWLNIFYVEPSSQIGLAVGLPVCLSVVAGVMVLVWMNKEKIRARFSKKEEDGPEYVNGHNTRSPDNTEGLPLQPDKTEAPESA